MAVLPETELGQIQFCEVHLPVWTANPAGIGLTGAQVAALAEQTSAARKAYDAAQAARLASKAATLLLHDAAARMRGSAADMVRSIKAFAGGAVNQETVYAAAQIPEPAAPTPPPLPGRPTAIRTELNPGGSLTLRWRAKNGASTSGAVYTIARRIGNGGYAGIGAAQGGPRGFFEFTDSSLPLGTRAASYIITGLRGKRTGTPSEAVSVQFGVGGGGEGEGLKMAA